MDVDFIGDYVNERIDGRRIAEIKTLIYRNGGVEISPGNIAEAIIPDRLLDHTRNIVIDGEEKEITIKGILNDGDAVAVGRFTGDMKYIVLEKTG